MNRKLLLTLSLLVVASLLLAACAPAEQEAEPTIAPVTTTEALPTFTPAAEAGETAVTEEEETTVAEGTTPAAAETAVTEEEETPAAEGTTPAAAGSDVEGQISIWHAWSGAEGEALQQAMDLFNEQYPNITFDLLSVPFDQLQNKFTTEASTGGGPTLLIGPKDWIGSLAQAGLILPLDEFRAEAGLDNLSEAALEANTFEDQIWAFPESTEAVALYYNTQLVDTPPASTAELLEMAPEVGVAFNSQFYYWVGFMFAGEDAALFDEEQRCVFDESEGTVGALEFAQQAQETEGVIVSAQTAEVEAAFKDGNVGFAFSGPWASGDFTAALGEGNVAVAPPFDLSWTDGQFSPFLGTKNFYLSANVDDAQRDAALAFMSFMSTPEAQQIMVEQAGHVPSNPDVEVESDIIAGFLDQTQVVTYFPNEPEMGAVWTPAGDMITQVIEGQMTADEAAAAACESINAANNR